MGKERLAVLFGGPSVEHEISVITALQAIEAIDTTRYHILPVYIAHTGKWYTGDHLFEKIFYRSPDYRKVDEITLLPDPSIRGFSYISKKGCFNVDLCLLAFHGQYGEDGCIQGLLEMANIPYTGGDVGSSSLAMNKHRTKIFLKEQGVPVLPSCLVTKKEAQANLRAATTKVCETLPFPLFVKPNHLGSSIAVSPAHDILSLHRALAAVFQYDDTALIEPLVEDLMEINVSVLDGDPPYASVVEVPISSAGVLSYEDKYLRDSNKITGASSVGMAGLTRMIDPSQLDANFKEEIRCLSLKVFNLMGCSGVCRIDYIWDAKSEELYFNEINPIPGSLAFYLWESSNPPLLYTELLEQMFEQARRRKAGRCSLRSLFARSGKVALN